MQQKDKGKKKLKEDSVPYRKPRKTSYHVLQIQQLNIKKTVDTVNKILRREITVIYIKDVEPPEGSR